MSTRTPAIEVVGLTKSYGDHPVLMGVDLTVPEGTVHALLGPNGAGKTTIVNICSTLLAADAGEIRVAGFDVRRDPDRVRAAIGVTGQFSAIDQFMTGRENLRLMADLGHVGRREATRVVDDLLSVFDLVDAADRRALTYSGGMKRRLDLAMTLVNRPRLIFLDEPTTGLDPRSRRDLWQIVREHVADGVTVLLTTQYLDEVDQVADQVAVLDGGRLVATGTPAQLKQRVPGGHVELQHADGATRTLPYDGTVAQLRRLLAGVDDAAITGVSVHTPDLDDVFLALTGHPTEPTEPTETLLEKETVR